MLTTSRNATPAPPLLRTSRFDLRLAEPTDAPALLAYFSRNHERFAPLDPRRPPDFYTESHWQAHVAAARKEFTEGHSVRLIMAPHDAPGTVGGSINFTNIIRGYFQACYLGYSIDVPYEGQGLMLEALQNSILYVFSTLNLHRIMANHLPDNERSARLLQRLGFKVEGRAEEYLLLDGAWRPHVLTALTNSRWKPSAAPANP